MISQLNLSKVRYSIIGSPSRRGISGGERKRVAIGKEMLANPSIVFLDEPTSGIDAFQAQSVVETFKYLAYHKNKMIVAVMHQPRASVFELFDYLILLAEGQLVYFGQAKASAQYFSSIGYSCPVQQNPADYMMDFMSQDTSTELLQKHSSSGSKYQHQLQLQCLLRALRHQHQLTFFNNIHHIIMNREVVVPVAVVAVMTLLSIQEVARSCGTPQRHVMT